MDVLVPVVAPLPPRLVLCPLYAFGADPLCWGVLAAVSLGSLGVVGAAPGHPFPRRC